MGVAVRLVFSQLKKMASVGSVATVIPRVVVEVAQRSEVVAGLSHIEKVLKVVGDAAARVRIRVVSCLVAGLSLFFHSVSM